MQKSYHLPDADRLSVLAATILLAYALARFVHIPASEIDLQLPGFYLSIPINVQTIVSLLLAGLTANGTAWLLQDHPHYRGQNIVEHWMLPAMTSWVIGLPLFQLPLGPLWWAGFFTGGVMLTLVLVAEYIVIDPDDMRRGPAAAVLTALSFALYLALAVSLRASGMRLFLLTPILALAAGLVSLRVLHLRLGERWAFLPAGFVALVITQFAAALQYWPLPPVPYGLLLLGPAYALTIFLADLEQGETLRQAAIEPAAVFGLIWLTALWIR